MCDKVAKAAAEWWIEQMKKRCTILYPNRIVRDKSGFVITDDSLYEELSRFEEILAGEIRNDLQKFHHVYLGCSHYPDTILSKLAKKSQIPVIYFPIQADMEIHNTSIRVSTGGNDSYEIRFSA